VCIRNELGLEKVLAQKAQAYLGPAPANPAITFGGLSSSSAAASDTRLALALSANTSIPLIAWSPISVPGSICTLRFLPLPTWPEPPPSEFNAVTCVDSGPSVETRRGGQPVMTGPDDCIEARKDSENEFFSSRGATEADGVDARDAVGV